MLALARLATSVAVIMIGDSTLNSSWPARFCLLEGLSGFPVLPFVLNGCLGIWLGVQRHQNETIWRRAVVVLMIFQVLIYISTFSPAIPALQPFIMTVRAGGKFAWMLVVSHLLCNYCFRQLTGPIDLLGRYALGSFVMHRISLQAMEIGNGQTSHPARLPHRCRKWL